MQRNASTVSSPPGAPEFDAHLESDCAEARGLIETLDRLEIRMHELADAGIARQRGYFPADYDDQVKQLILDYRHVRLAMWDILLRYQDYARIADETLRMRAFIVAFATGLSLYGKSLILVQTFEHVPLVRAKLNEPDSKYGLEAGFFEQLLQGYSSLGNYWIFTRATAYWRRNRRLAARLGIDSRPGWDWLADHIARERHVIRRRFWHVLRTRLRRDWRCFWKTATIPLRGATYNLQALVGGRFAEYRFDPNRRPGLDTATVDRLRAQLRPGDILMIRAEGKLTTALLPGFWAHAAIYLGGRTELETLSIATHPAVAPHWDGLPSGSDRKAAVLEAVNPRVQIRSHDTCLHADHVCVLRPALPEREIAEALTEAFGHLGKPYDFDFDFNHATRLVCTALVYRTFHGRGKIAFDLVKRVGRWTLTGDDLMSQSLANYLRHGDGSAPVLRPVALVLTGHDHTPKFIETLEITPTLERIRTGWRPNGSG